MVSVSVILAFFLLDQTLSLAHAVMQPAIPSC